MGGDYYDRDVLQVDNTTTQNNSAFSKVADQLLDQQQNMHRSLDPLRWIDEKMICENKQPIVFALDVSGSMGNWTKIIYDKMPMFYGQIMIQKYLDDPSISFCAIGDCKTDKAPLQVSEFGQGSEIDQLITKIWLEGNGGGNKHESYDLSAYFYLTNVDLIGAELPFFFITGDEGFWETTPDTVIKKLFGKGMKEKEVNSRKSFAELMTKYNVFHIKKEFCPRKDDVFIKKQWQETLGEERVMQINEAKACIDVVLGLIALTSGTRDIVGYISDMKTRGQTEERINEVVNALSPYYDKLIKNEINIVRFKANPLNKIKLSSNNDISNNNNNNNFNIQYVQMINKNFDFSQIIENYENLLLEDLENKDVIYYKNLRILKKNNKGKIPEELLCPITGEIFFDPVLTYDGHSYERKAIEMWLEDNNISPRDGTLLQSKTLMPNFALKQVVSDFFQSSK